MHKNWFETGWGSTGYVTHPTATLKKKSTVALFYAVKYGFMSPTYSSSPYFPICSPYVPYISPYFPNISPYVPHVSPYFPHVCPICSLYVPHISSYFPIFPHMFPIFPNMFPMFSPTASNFLFNFMTHRGRPKRWVLQRSAAGSSPARRYQWGSHGERMRKLSWLVVTGCHEFYFPINIGCLIIPIDELHHFSEGWLKTTNQLVIYHGDTHLWMKIY